ncbi:pyridoxamine 5'-phosphate oxidase family protein [Flavobacterium aquatile]|uniref:Pyridoxamine 5'-phosphate oxidase n=1 Tax=Flavobacterium aquatile LMG 4008 = ATCC 11947 TaxID=1453498 RepID=A0A095V4A9_9FLAO|nr:pyridoxamine 5'-phosphate oxidase family protein [Flavobacterium aquatile]KGD69705.1 pyridoxamine 5'-phosphate oxidase [Flavobacterium aquatile LMG 4008 = ATCC 11947]OXA67161.1 pyridoxamine 5'-phosphate oxidase [Flavobacterium aquatile LMG 4008 = ATCC 11947]GEC77814.1 pyridoxamine 5'-phosphate oxidase [Flavobacterium aquatile]
MNYLETAFTNTIKKMQEKIGSRNSYARMEQMSYVDGLTDYEIEFITQQDSFYMATHGENDFPYVQHRGGPQGFIKIINDSNIGIVDFIGNRQYISVGNIINNPKVALIMVSYPRKARLKIYAEAQIIELKDDDKLYEFLKPDEYKFRPERMIVFNIKAYDWNCPQHIIPRFTAAEIEEAFAPQKKYITDLENQIKDLKEILSKK